MKRFICLIIALCLILSSFSFSFAVDWSTTDQSNLSNIASRLIYNGFSAARLLYDIDSTLSTISSTLSTISSRLVYGNYSISYWVNSISTWMQPIYGRLSDIITQGMNLDSIAGLLGLTETINGVTVRTPYLAYNGVSVAEYFNNFNQLDILNGFESQGGGSSVSLRNMGSNGNVSTLNLNLSRYNWRQNIPYALLFLNNNTASGFNQLLQNYANTQSLVSFADPDSTVTFTPTSATDGIYKYLNAINTPLARLGYVLASDSRIEAQQAAAANEQEVVDSFIDSNGSGSASTSDFSDMAGLSSGYSSNFNTGQSASGLFTVFGSDKWTYLSQETMDSFDTTQSENRRSKSNTEYDTPYLDRYYDEVLSLMGLEND